MRHLIVVLGLTLHVRKQVLSRESHGACFFPRKLLPSEIERPSPKGQGCTIKFLDPLYETY